MIIKNHLRKNRIIYSVFAITSLGILVSTVLVLFILAAYQLEKNKFDLTANQTVMSIFFEKARTVKYGLESHKNLFITQTSNGLQLKLSDSSFSLLKSKLSEEMFEFERIDSIVISELKSDGLFTAYNYNFSITKLKIEVNETLTPIIGKEAEKKTLILFERGTIDKEQCVSHSFFFHSDKDFIEITLNSYFPAKHKAILTAMSDQLIISCIVLLIVVLLIILTIKNIYKQKRVAEMMSDFIDNITHEFNTPLSTINLIADVLKQNNKESTLVQSNTLMIKKQVTRLRQMVNNAMDLSLLSKQEKSIQLEPKQIHHLIDSCTGEYALKHPGLSITKMYTDQNDTVPLDEFHMTTVINNLIDNSLKYSSKSVVNIKIGTTIAENQFIIYFWDDGPGIENHDSDKIFDKFYRGGARIGISKGLGLGLHLVKWAISAHHGSIQLDTKNHEGARFIIKLPI